MYDNCYREAPKAPPPHPHSHPHLRENHSALPAFRKTVSSLSSDNDERTLFFKGFITQVLMYFPPGSQYKVGVRVLHLIHGQAHYVVPSFEGEYIVLSNALPLFNLRHPIDKGDRIRVEWINHDNTFSHTIPVFVVVTGEE